MTDYHPHPTRSAYLESLAIEHGIDLSIVRMMAGLLGPSEDFDGLVTALEDYTDDLERE
jgi:hypothetical protein